MFDRPLPTRRQSAEEVLAELTLGAAGLDATNTLAEWDAECEITPDVPETVVASSVDELRRVLERWFGVAIPAEEAKRVLSPLKARTLGELATYIAERAEVAAPVIVRLGGEESVSAGLFIALRGALARRGVHAGRLRPSTPLSRLVDKHPTALRGALREVAPAHPVETALRRPRLALVLWVLATGGMVLTIGGRWLGGVALLFGPVAAVIGLVGGLVTNRLVVVHGGDRYETVADWCRAAAGER